MRIKIVIFLLLASGYSYSQTYNTVQNWTAQKPISTESDIISPSHPAQEVLKTTTYMDGFNRLVQSVAKGISPGQQDAVNMHVYDAWGREVQQYLPFISGTDGAFKNNAQSLQTSFYQGLYPGESNFYSRVDLENSPLNRVLKTYAPGASWSGSNRGSSAQFLVNTITDNIRIWNIAAAPGSLPTNSTYYGPGLLYKSMGTDEKGLQIIEYKDKDGHVVLKKIQVSATADNGSGSPHSGWLCTYFVYDDFGNMRFIITPKMVSLIDGIWVIPQTDADELCYRLEYDEFNRVIIQKSPGTPSGSPGEIWTVYDQRGRVVMKQDGNLRNQQKWQYFQYDPQDRAIITGLIYDPSNYNNRTYHQNLAIGQINYPSPLNYSYEILSQTYFDNYNWVAGTGSGIGTALDQSNINNTSLFYTPSNTTAPYPQEISQSSKTRGLITGKKAEVLESGGSQYLYTVSFFDNKGRVIQTQANNISGAIDKSTTQYSWRGAPLRIYEQHSKSAINQTHAILTKMTYDHGGRILTIVKNISSTINSTAVNSGDKTIASYTYKETGQVLTKTVGNSLESQTFDYNVRGWLTGINKNYTLAGNTGHVFGEELGYDKTTTTAGTTNFITPTYNGSISGQVWRSKGDGVTRKYDFNYDNLNQLTAAPYLQNTSGSAWDKSYIDYSVNSMSYDLNGNIKTLNQNGFALGGAPNMDNLGYNYENNDKSNRLKNVIDNANISTSKLGDFHYAISKTVNSTDFGYDFNGNLTSDANKGITSISYNRLNLPYVITFPNGTITYLYDWNGNKLKKTVVENNASVNYEGTNYSSNITTVTTYIGGFTYQSKAFTHANLAPLNKTETILYTAQEEGRIRLTTLVSGAPAWAFDYFIRDHLGNVRATLTDEAQTDVYPSASLEPAGIASEQKYYNITNDASHVILTSSLGWWNTVSGNSYNNGNGLAAPPDPTTNPGSPSTKLYKLNGNTGDRFGMGIALKVMAGDAINIYGRSVWHSGGSTNNTSYQLSNVLTNFINAFGGTNAVAAGTKGAANGTSLNANPTTTVPLGTMLNNVPTPAGQTPKAYINWILFDDQFKPVAGGNGADLIHINPDVVKPHSISGISINTSGYLYVYCSNESNQDVYFDNLQVVHTRGFLLEERQYYPQGLSMFFLSSRAFGKLQANFGYQGKEMNSGEFYDGSGWDAYDFESRYYDPQLARWWAQDPAGQFSSPYNAMGNNWPNGIDPNGKWFGWDDLIVSAIGFLTGYVMSGITSGDWGWRSVKAGFISAAMFEIGYYSAGASTGISQGGLANIFSSAGFPAQANTVGLAFAGKTALVSVVGSLIPGINVPIGNNFSIGISPALAISGGQLTGGFNISASYDDGNLAISGGIGASANSFSWGGGVSYGGFGGSYAHNKFNGENAQITATLGVYAFGASFRLDEDYVGDGKDRWRTGAVELGINNFVIGLSVYTNDGLTESGGKSGTHEQESPIYKSNKTGKGAWNNGQAWHSPAWIGFRNGNQVSRFGFSHREVQDFFQNGLHQNWFPTPYYLNYDNFTKGLYNYSGFYNPFTLY